MLNLLDAALIFASRFLRSNTEFVKSLNSDNERVKVTAKLFG